MKRSIQFYIIFILVLLVWWFWPSAHVSTGSTNTNMATGAEVRSANPADGQRPASVSPDAGAPAGVSTQLAAQERQLQLRREVAQLSNKPIEFYGVVLDQDENPIPGVKVTLGIRTTKEPLPGMIGDTFDYPVLTTDEQGKFAITGVKGALLSLKSLEKEGYEASKRGINQAYWYWRSEEMVFHPDAGKPEVFRMWKMAGADRLVTKGIGQRIPYDGTTVRFGLLDGSNDDLRVTLTRNPQQIQRGQTKYEWTATIEVPNGGIIQSTAEQMYRAPAEGYQPKAVVHMAANDPQWTDMKTVTFYLSLQGGKYYGRAELEFSVGSERPTTPFSIRAYINPSGSRNLEYDPLQDMARPRVP
jgi:hypothetical protein